MKTIRNTGYSLLFCLTFLGSGILYAQDYNNEIGFEVLGLLNADLQLTYERPLGAHTTWGLGLGLKMDEGIVKLSGLDTEFIQTNDITYSGFKVTPAFRYYLNEVSDGMDGFYVGGFAKIQRYKSDLLGDYVNSSDEQFVVDVDGKFNVTSFGVMVGYKLALGERMSLDFLIAGPGLASHKYEFTNRQPLPDEFYDDLNDDLNNYSVLDLIGAEFDFEGGSGETRESSFSLPAFRYAMTLTYSF
ncbi:DUF3575 domain-containing protein [Lutimonas sp.]|uniref:DUF3575 domain-containing protein n=1 Tax=Lutimonas sp. TaxID=1872403 RepID=UPI003D9AD0B7